jgi:methionyl-tRNA synthetase
MFQSQQRVTTAATEAVRLLALDRALSRFLQHVHDVNSAPTAPQPWILRDTNGRRLPLPVVCAESCHCAPEVTRCVFAGLSGDFGGKQVSR